MLSGTVCLAVGRSGSSSALSRLAAAPWKSKYLLAAKGFDCSLDQLLKVGDHCVMVCFAQLGRVRIGR